MRKRTLILAICLGIVFILTITLWHEPQAQAPMEGGPPGGAPNMMGGFREQMAITQALPLDSSWTFLSFEVELSDEALVKARKLYQDAWNQRKEKITDKMEELRGDPDAMSGLRTEAEKIWSNLKAKLNEILTPEQSEKLATWEKENKNQVRMMPGGSGNRRQR
ncbi:TPA: hypothetical protein ENS27_04905 [bacterium]|nr:hypothetical protein [bacterium]